MLFEIRRVFSVIKQRALRFRRNSDSTKPTKPIMNGKDFSEIPVVVILGETGVGKTKLSIDLCRRFEGEVISADSMQIYDGLDIITNKVTPDEACGVPHHMIGVLSPSSSTFNVQMFQNEAVKITEHIWRNRRKLPVIVGGTSYYIEALLWDRLVGTREDEDGRVLAKEESDTFVKHIPFDVNSMTDEQVHEELRRVDPVMASRKHPKNRRRVIRSLQIFYESGRPHSQWLLAQHSSSGGNLLGGPLRFPRLCLLWLTCDDRAVLHDRLRRRVDEMVKKGLKNEITAFYDRYYGEYTERYVADDVTTKGIFQSIGLKEFEKYLKLSVDQRSTEAGSKAFDEGVEKLKLITLRYAKKQKQWITNRICRLAARDSIPIYCLDATDVGKWHENVSVLAEHVVDAFLSDRRPDRTIKVASASLDNYLSEFTAENKYCETCDRLVSGLQWTAHMKSKRHRILVLSKAEIPTMIREQMRKASASNFERSSSDVSDPEEDVSRIVP